jgi:hypothetical protein
MLPEGWYLSTFVLSVSVKSWPFLSFQFCRLVHGETPLVDITIPRCLRQKTSSVPFLWLPSPPPTSGPNKTFFYYWLFNDAFSSSYFKLWNERITSQILIVKDVKGSGSGLIINIFPAFSASKRRNPGRFSCSIADVPAGIRSGPPECKPEAWSQDPSCAVY